MLMSEDQHEVEAICKFYSDCLDLDLEQSQELAQKNGFGMQHILMAWTIKCVFYDTDDLPNHQLVSKEDLAKFRFYNKNVATYYRDCIKTNMTPSEIMSVGMCRNLPMDEMLIAITFKRIVDENGGLELP